MQKNKLTITFLLLTFPIVATALGLEEFTLNGLDHGGHILVLEPAVAEAPLRVGSDEGQIIGVRISQFSYRKGKSVKNLPISCTLIFGKSLTCMRNTQAALTFSYAGEQVTDFDGNTVNEHAKKALASSYRELYTKWLRISDCKRVDSIYTCTQNCDAELPAKLLLNWCGD